MSNLSSFLGPPYLSSTIRAFYSSGSFTPVRDVLAMVTVVGGGGGGAAINRNTGTTALGFAQGGAAGAFCQRLLRLKAGTTYTVNVGVGGAGAVRTTDNSDPGSAGTSSSFSGTGITTMTANGGAGGGNQYVTAAINTTYTTAGQTAATASGGEINASGGVGGSFSWRVNALPGAQQCYASGGGAVNCFNLAAGTCDGGNISINDTGTYVEPMVITGGGGVAGHGGDYTGNGSVFTMGATAIYATGGGGGGGSATNYTQSALPPDENNSYAGTAGAGTTEQEGVKVYMPIGTGSPGFHVYNSSYTTLYTLAKQGGGGGAVKEAIVLVEPERPSGGVFGGGGAVYLTAASGDVYGGNGGIGGGGGGAIGTSGTMYGGTGGNGVVFVDFIPI